MTDRNGMPLEPGDSAFLIDGDEEPDEPPPPLGVIVLRVLDDDRYLVQRDPMPPDWRERGWQEIEQLPPEPRQAYSELFERIIDTIDDINELGIVDLQEPKEVDGDDLVRFWPP